MECLAFYGGTDAVIRNTRFHNCSVFHIFISASQSTDFSNILIEGNRFSCAEQAVSNAVKFSNHGFRYTKAVMRNNTFDCQETYVASSTTSQLVYEGNTGGGLHLNNGGPKPSGTLQPGWNRRDGPDCGSSAAASAAASASAAPAAATATADECGAGCVLHADAQPESGDADDHVRRSMLDRR